MSMEELIARHTNPYFERPLKNTLTDPFRLRQEDGYQWLKGNLHSHTTFSDGLIGPEQRRARIRPKKATTFCPSRTT